MRILILLLLPFLIAAAPTKTNNFASSTTIRASEVNTNFDDIYGYVQTGVDTLRTDAVDVITEIKSTLRSGSDSVLITGSKGSNEQMCVWNSDGDTIGISTMTGNTAGIKVIGVGFAIDTLISCTNLGTDATGVIICN